MKAALELAIAWVQKAPWRRRFIVSAEDASIVFRLADDCAGRKGEALTAVHAVSLLELATARADLPALIVEKMISEFGRAEVCSTVVQMGALLPQTTPPDGPLGPISVRAVVLLPQQTMELRVAALDGAGPPCIRIPDVRGSIRSFNRFAVTPTAVVYR